MNIIKKNYSWRESLENRQKTEYIVLHHRAGCGDVESIHRQHLDQGFSGIGYHFYVRKTGEVFKGRPIGTVGAHCKGVNKVSVGVCFEGNFETEKEMLKAQIKAGRELVGYLKMLYPDAQVMRHRDLQATACPGQNFPFENIKKGVAEMTAEEAVEIIQAKSGLEDETIEFLLCYKYGEELVVKIAEAMV